MSEPRQSPAWMGALVSPAAKRFTILAMVVGVWVGLAHAWQDDNGDGMDEAWQAFFGVATGTNNAVLDPDGDGLSNLAESRLRTDPFVADTDRDGFPDGLDSNPVSRAVFPWGDARFTRTNDVVYTWPDWTVSAFKDGGEWNTSAPCWWVPATETGLVSLNLEVDRGLLTNNLRLRLPLGAGSNAELYCQHVGLLHARGD